MTLTGSKEAPLRRDYFEGPPCYWMPYSEGIHWWAKEHPKAREVWVEVYVFNHICAELGSRLGAIYPTSRFAVEVPTDDGPLTIRAWTR